MILTIPDNVSDCSSSAGADMVTGVEHAYFGWTTAGSGAISRTWLPFTVPLPNSQKITSAILTVTAYATLSGFLQVDLGCEAADNPTAPGSWADISTRTMTTAKQSALTIVNYVANTQYQYDVTASVQEVLNRAGWINGNTLAIFVIGFDHDGGVGRRIATSEHATLQEPTLTISVPIVPRGSSM